MERGIAMPTYLMFGTSMQAARSAVSARRTEDALGLTNSHGGEFKMGCALLSEGDFVVTLGLPDAERAIPLSVDLSRLLNTSFRASRAASIDASDWLAADSALG
jgi:hypothetical protein